MPIRQKLLLIVFALLLSFSLAIAQETGDNANQNFVISWSSTPPISGRNATFVFSVTASKETDYLRRMDLTDFSVSVCISGKCETKSEQFLFDPGEERKYEITREIPDKVARGVVRPTEFTCDVNYEYPSNGTVRIEYKRFDKSFPLVYEESFKIEHIQNETIPVVFIQTQSPQSQNGLEIFGLPLTFNWLSVSGIAVFALGIFLLLVGQRWGILFIVVGIVLLIVGFVILK